MPERLMTKALFYEVCDRIANGETVRAIFASKGNKPNKQTFYHFVQRNEDPEIKDAYKFARQAQASGFVEEIIEIADNTKRDTRVRNAVARDTLKIEARKWLASRYAPGLFGDKLAVTGPNGGPIQVIKSNMTEEQAAAAYAATLDQA
jgi:hypothetical protein